MLIVKILFLRWVGISDETNIYSQILLQLGERVLLHGLIVFDLLLFLLQMEFIRVQMLAICDGALDCRLDIDF